MESVGTILTEDIPQVDDCDILVEISAALDVKVRLMFIEETHKAGGVVIAILVVICYSGGLVIQ